MKKNNEKKFVKIFLAFCLTVLITGGAFATTYYVSTATGASDSNSGTQASPWRTINASVAKLSPGDILYVRGGTYAETVSVNVTATSYSSPITISAYTGESPVIDGQNTLPTSYYGALVSLNGNYIHISGFEVKNTVSGNDARGIQLVGHHNTVSNCNVHHIYTHGILVFGDYGIAEDNRVWQTCLSNVNGSGGGMWGNGINAARDQVNGITLNAILRRNTVYNNWGEGLSTYEANGTIIEDNIVYDNWATNIYISDAIYVLFQRNMVYVTSGNSFGQSPVIMLADEVANKPRSTNNTIINNLFVNGRAALFSWTGVSGSGLTNLLFANNTLSNAEVKTGTINSGDRIINNIFTGGGNILSTSGVTWSHNCWLSGTRPSNAVGTSDVLGDPLLALTGTVSPGQLTADYFKLSSASSPAISAGTALTEVTEDYFGTTRSNPPDMGGHEYVPSTVAVTGVSVSPTTASIPYGGTSQLTETVAPSNATNKTVTWSSSNTAVATVNSSGLVTAVTAGTATITVTTQDGGFYATCGVTVSSYGSNLLVNPGFETAITPDWYNCCGSVLTQGTTYHSGSHGCDVTSNVGFSATQEVTAAVSAIGSGVYHVEAWVKMASGSATTVNIQLRATVGGTNYFGTPTATASVGTSWTKVSGDVTLTYTGTPSVVKFFIETPSSSANYSVDDCMLSTSSSVAVTGVSVSPTTASITAGGTSQLTATVAPSNATNKTVTWSSSNTAVATVNSSGLVTAVAAGTATITVTTQDGGFTSTCAVTVASTNMLVNPGFETAIATNWYNCCGSVLTQGTTYHSGSHGCDVTSNVGFSATQEVTTAVSAIGSAIYHVEAWVKMATGSATTVNIQLRATVGGTNYFGTPTATASVGTSWAKVSGDVTLTYSGTPSVVKFFIETPSSSANYSVDDCVLQFTGLKSASIATNVAKVDRFEIILYPNPATTSLTVEFPEFQKNEQMRIYNSIGKLTKVVNVSSARQQINIEDLPAGLYVVRFEQSQNSSMKFIKK